jgi:hypothetical protein
MNNRKTKQKEQWIEEITKEWQLSLNETTFLEDCFDLIQYRDAVEVAQNLINYYFSNNWDKLLSMIPAREVKNYAEIEFDMIEEGDCEEEKTLEDFDDYEIADEYFDRRLGEEDKLDIVVESQLEELTSKFLAADFAKRNEVLNSLKWIH